MKKLLRSRTFWTLVIMFVISGIEGIRETIDPQLFTFIMAGLTALAGYFKMSPSQDYNG